MNTPIKILAVGCSFTYGHGLDFNINDSKLWVNKIFSTVPHTIDNVSKSATNNDWIFLETMSQLIQKNYDVVLVGWSAIPRYNFHVGLELYPVHTMLQDLDINLNSGNTVSGKFLKNLGDGLKKIHNDHWDLLTLIKYVNVLIEIQERTRNGKIFFVNALGPWSNGYFTKKAINLPSDLTLYEQKLLETDSRDDDEIFNLYNMIHKQYATYGGIQEAHWLNLYNSLLSMQVDVVSSTDGHPGYQSQQVYEKYLSPILKEKLK
jgi:hypothetical protein